MGSVDKRVLIDASVWIAYFDIEDSHTAKAKKLFEEFLRDRTILLLSDYVIQEILTVLLYKRKTSLVEMFTQYLKDEALIQIVDIDTLLLHKTIQFAKSHEWRPKLSLTDWSLLFLAKNLELPLYTFDIQLEHAYRNYIQ